MTKIQYAKRREWRKKRWLHWLHTVDSLMTLVVLRQVVVLCTHRLSYKHQLQFHSLCTHWRHVSCREQSKKAKLRDTKSLFVSELRTLNGTSTWSLCAGIIGRLLIGGVGHDNPFSKTVASIGVELPKTHLYFALAGNSGKMRMTSCTLVIWLIGILLGSTISKSIHWWPVPSDNQRWFDASLWHALRMVHFFSNEHQPQNGSRDSKQLEQFV